MSITQDFFTEQGASAVMEALYSKFDDAVAFVEECYQNRSCFEVSEEDNPLTDQQIHFLMDDFLRTIKLMVKNKVEDV